MVSQKKENGHRENLINRTTQATTNISCYVTKTIIAILSTKVF